MISINYERALFYSKNNNPVLLSIGISHTIPNYNSLGYKWFGFPIWMTSIYGKRKSHLETGIGYWWTKSYNQTEQYKDDRRVENTFLAKVGYRYQKQSGNGFNFRIGIESGFYRSWDHDYWDSDFIASLFLSIGYSF